MNCDANISFATCVASEVWGPPVTGEGSRRAKFWGGPIKLGKFGFHCGVAVVEILGAEKEASLSRLFLISWSSWERVLIVACSLRISSCGSWETFCCLGGRCLLTVAAFPGAEKIFSELFFPLSFNFLDAWVRGLESFRVFERERGLRISSGEKVCLAMLLRFLLEMSMLSSSSEWLGLGRLCFARVDLAPSVLVVVISLKLSMHSPFLTSKISMSFSCS